MYFINQSKDSVNKPKLNNHNDNGDEYKDKNYAALENDESVINRPKENKK